MSALDVTACWSVKGLNNEAVETSKLGRAEVGLAERYSRFKFGDVDAIKWFSVRLARQLKAEIERPGSALNESLRVSASQGHYLYGVAPGVRNVVSSSNYLLREALLYLNCWLTAQGMPTYIIRALPRLQSGRANYAELGVSGRLARKKTTQTIIPESDFVGSSIHILFIDDFIASGATLNRARVGYMAAGAQSFCGAALFEVVEGMRASPELEHCFNSAVIDGGLSDELSQILSHPDYQPVQRMIRLLLHPKNSDNLIGFLKASVSDAVLARLYLAAMSNDFLWISAGETQGDRELGLYGASLSCLSAHAKQCGVTVDL